MVSLVLATAASLAPPYLAKLAIDDGITRGRPRRAEPGSWPRSSLSALVYWGATYLQTYLVGWVGQRALQDLRLRIFTHLQRQSIGFFSRRKTGVLISRLTNDMQALDQLVTDGIVTLFSSTLTLVGTVVILLLLDVPLALVTFLATFPVLAVGQRRCSATTRPAPTGRVREKIANVTAYLQETLSGVRIVRAFGQEPRHEERFAELNDEHRAANYRTVQLNASYFPGVELLSSIGTAVILLYGGYQAIDGDITIGVLVAFVGYLQSFFDPIQQLSNLYVDLPAGHGRDRQDLRPARHRAGHAGRARARASWARSGATSSSTACGSATATRRGRRREPAWALRDVSLRHRAPARRSRWSARRARASRRSRSWWRASTTRSAAPCASTGTTCAR